MSRNYIGDGLRQNDNALFMGLKWFSRLQLQNTFVMYFISKHKKKYMWTNGHSDLEWDLRMYFMLTYFVNEILLCSFNLLLQQKLLKLHSLSHSVTESILQLYNIYIFIWNNSLVVTILKPLIRNQGHSCQPRPAALYFLHSGHWLPVVSNNFFHFRIADNGQLFRSWVAPVPSMTISLLDSRWQTEGVLRLSWSLSHSHMCVTGQWDEVWLVGR